jgi:hypothetical protein
MTMKLPLASVRLDGGTQPRLAIDDGVVTDYAEAMADGATFPNVVAFFDGEVHWLADGFHRVAAARRNGMEEIGADVRQGTRRDAVLFALGANHTHGLQRSDHDKRRAVVTMLRDEEWGKWSDNEIARRCAVSHPYVGKIRASLVTVSSDQSADRTYKTRHGKTTTMRTGKIGRGGKPKVLCDRCQRVGETKDCQTCKDARQAARERQPGEGDAPVTSNGQPMTSRKPGEPIFDDAKIHDLFGKLVRSVDNRARACGMNQAPRSVLGPLNTFIDAFKKWQKEPATV